MHPTLKAKVTISVRFSEVDSIGIVWHGHFIQYLEEGREAWGRQFELSYQHIFSHNIVTPIVHLECQYKKPIQYGDRIVVECTYVDQMAAKLMFHYNIWNADETILLATAQTTQVFVDKASRELLLNAPTFFEEWKIKYLSH
jgi:acyl-CoA thioester hydrolase